MCCLVRNMSVLLRENRPINTHILDKMQFLYEKQLEFYKKFEEAVRKTGYKGVLIGSCWQAGSGISHFYNLHADYEIGMIDRHNYFGGGEGGHQIAEGLVKNDSHLWQPVQLLSTGLQAVIDRPFSLSEWMSLVPNEWTAETAPLIAVYGMGLQGWDASFSFATDIPRFSNIYSRKVMVFIMLPVLYIWDFILHLRGWFSATMDREPRDSHP